MGNMITVEDSISSDELLAQVYDEAARLYESGELTWHKGSYGDDATWLTEGPRGCMMRAIDKAAMRLSWGKVHDKSLLGPIQDTIARETGEKFNVPLWNDSVCESVGEAIDMLRRAAKDVRNG